MRRSILTLTLCAFTAAALAADVRESNNSKSHVHVPLYKHPTIVDMWRKSNAHREIRGLPPHNISPELCRAAQNHAEYMARTGDFSHYSNGGYQGRANKFGYHGAVRENIAMGQPTVISVFDTWINSSGHYASIMSDTTDAGFGLAYSKSGTPYWVAEYGSPDPSAAQHEAVVQKDKAANQDDAVQNVAHTDDGKADHQVKQAVHTEPTHAADAPSGGKTGEKGMSGGSDNMMSQKDAATKDGTTSHS